MIPVLLIVIPLLSGLLGFFMKQEKLAKGWSLLSSLITMAVAISAYFTKDVTLLRSTHEWIPLMGSNFSVSVVDGMGRMLAILTGISFPLIFLATYNTNYTNGNRFHALMLLTQAGLMGVFVASDALLFYFFWELALIPTYFLCSIWGGEKRIAVTFKFFIYTFIGSLLMLVGIIYLYYLTPDHSFALQAFYDLKLNNDQQSWLFWLFFIAFAIKMPIFPFHTWQPDAYEQAPTATTMVLSGVMVKMGVFAMLRWLIPIFPAAFWSWGDFISFLGMFGIVYASLLAMQQDDLKKLVAYSSIAHIGLMVLAIVSTTDSGIQGVMIQMFNHGINIIGMWVVVALTERQFGTRKISELGGIAQKAPALTILLVVIAFANIGLPLTNAFIGEFLMFTGVFTSNVSQYNYIYTAIAGLGIILAAVYTLNMIQKVFFGSTNSITANGVDISFTEKLALSVLVIIILVVGVHPQPILDLTNDTTLSILNKMITKHP